MTFNSFDIRAALLLAATAIVSIAFASDEAVDTPEHVTGEQRYPFDSADPREEDEPPIELPDSVAPKLELLTPEEVEFLRSGDARAFTGPAEDTVEALNDRTPEEVKAWINAMQQVVNHNQYQEGRDAPNIPLNTRSPDFNAWRLQRREPWTRSANPVRSPLVATMALAVHQHLAGTPWRCRRKTWSPARSMSRSWVRR